MADFDRSAYLDDIRAGIAKHGHMVQFVGRSTSAPSAWSYTIGLHAHGLPELIIVGGLGMNGQHGVLNNLAKRLRSGDELAVGSRDPSVLEGFEVTYLDVADTNTEDFAVALKLQSKFRALQVVWPDLDNRLPWEPGYSFPATEQRLLGPPPSTADPVSPKPHTRATTHKQPAEPHRRTPHAGAIEERLTIVCEAHGERYATAICPHLLDGSGKGWHMLGSGNDQRPDAICSECMAAWDPELTAQEAGIGIAVVCTECYDGMRARHDIARP